MHWIFGNRPKVKFLFWSFTRNVGKMLYKQCRIWTQRTNSIKSKGQFFNDAQCSWIRSESCSSPRYIPTQRPSQSLMRLLESKTCVFAVFFCVCEFLSPVTEHALSPQRSVIRMRHWLWAKRSPHPKVKGHRKEVQQVRVEGKILYWDGRVKQVSSTCSDF